MDQTLQVSLARSNLKGHLVQMKQSHQNGQVKALNLLEDLITKAKKSIAGFKVREDMPLGVKVTLRGVRMFEFLDRLINIAMPRIRDFRGVSPKSFDGRGNYAMGLKEHIVFPEIDFDKAENMWGMDIVICTSAKTNDEAKALLAEFNMPFTH